MATPKVVQRQLEQAEALAQSQRDQMTAAPQLVTDASQLLETPPPAPEPPAAPPPPPPAPTENWEQRYKTVQGMYQAEVPRLQAQVKTYESDLAALKKQVLVLSEAAEQRKQTQTQAQRPQVDPKDVESFGAEMIEMVGRHTQHAIQVMNEAFEARAAQFESRMKAIEETISGVSNKTNATLEQQFYATLAQLVPDWEQINTGQDWLAWLAEIDPVYGVPRQVALDHAHKQGDVQRVAAVFKMFKSTRKPKASADLASQVSPTGSGAGPVAAQPAAAPQLISQKFVNTYYADVFKGRYKGREEEAKRIEAQINQAAAEGRIV